MRPFFAFALRPSSFAFLLFPLLAFSVTGCGPYRLQGVVVEANTTSVEVISADDLSQDRGLPLDDTSIQVVFEPRTSRPKKLGLLATDAQGRFSLTIDQPGAGFMEYEILVIARKPGYNTAWEIMRLPSSSSAIQFSLSKGQRDDAPSADGYEETLQMRRLLDQ